MNTLLESAQFDLLHDPDGACLYAIWRGPHSRLRTQATYELILTEVQATRSKRLLHDTLLDDDGWQELTNWIAQECFPHLAQAGIVAVAWVLRLNHKALFDTRKVLDKLTEPLVEPFTDVEAAYTWLQQWPRAREGNFSVVLL